MYIFIAPPPTHTHTNPIIFLIAILVSWRTNKNYVFSVAGQPLKIEDLGETQIPFEVFNEYLLTHSKDRFSYRSFKISNSEIK